MKIEPFNCLIENASYVEVKKEDKESMYCCNISFREMGRGCAFVKHSHNAILYMNKEQFENKLIEKGDFVKITNSKWRQIPVYYTSYNKEVINKTDKSKLKVDKDGKTFFSERIFSYKISIPADSWELLYKWYDLTYLMIGDSKIKLPLLNKGQFKDNQLDFILEEPEFAELQKYNNTQQTIIGYYKNKKYDSSTRQILVYMDENDNFVLRINKLEEDADNG